MSRKGGQAVIDRSILRLEDKELLTGMSRYVADIRLPGQLNMRVVRSPFAHGKLRSINVEEARKVPGVVAVWSAPDVIAALGSMPYIQPRLSFDETVRPYLQPVLAVDRVRYVGEPIAVVIAADSYTAEDAGSLVLANIEPLPAVTDLRGAVNSEPVFPDGNLIATLEEKFGDPDGAFTGAPVVIEAELMIGRHTGAPIETRGLLVDYVADTDSVVVYGSTKVPHANRAQLAEHLAIPEGRIRMRETAVGGGFGVRGEYYPEDFLVAWAALQLRQPVSWVEDRAEHFVATNHSREQFHRAAIAGDEAGTIHAVRSEFWADLGAYVRTAGLRVPELTLGSLLGPYDILNFAGKAHCVVTNRTPTGTVRGPGRFESSFVMDRLIDLFAAKIDADPWHVRRQNLVSPDQLPYERPMLSAGLPIILDSGDYPALFDQVVRKVGRETVQSRRARGENVGVGIGVFLEKSGLGPWEMASVRVQSDERISVRTGCTSLGQGLRTVVAQIVAEELDVVPSRVHVELLDTDEIRTGVGTYASRSTTTAGSAAFLAARRVAERAREIASQKLQTDPADLVIRDGGLEVAGSPDLRMTFGQISTLLLHEASGNSLGLYAEETFTVERDAYSFGAHAAVVRIDKEIGQVIVEHLVLCYDVGRAINPLLVEGQLQGGAVQALGGTLLEHLVYDENGTPLATSFMDYLLPSASEAPAMMTVIVSEQAPAETNPLGIKGCGEAGVPGIAAAIASAVEDALGSPGLILQLPITNQRLHEFQRRVKTE